MKKPSQKNSKDGQYAAMRSEVKKVAINALREAAKSAQKTKTKPSSKPNTNPNKG